MQGIPGNLSLNYIRKWTTSRVSAKRLRHIEGVEKVAAVIARAYGCDLYLIQLAAWLHDSCKETRSSELVEQARAFNIKISPIEEQEGHLLHGPVAARVVQSELGIENGDLLAAIAEHTLGNVPMCKLSEVLYLSDCLEESRPKKFTGPIWEALSLDQELNIDRAIVKATDLSLVHLMDTGRPIHPLTIDVRNYYLERVKRRSPGQ